MGKDYYLGLDMGTDSIGWAVTDTEYRLKKFKGNAMWGIRLFDESNTAQERRAFRTARRRTQRKKERLCLLEMLFDGEISKIDNTFFRRLRESNLYPSDKTVDGKYAVFADENYTDKDYFKEYPTIYHLRWELISNPAPHDARLVFIALHHIIKNRGHFLFDSLESVDDFLPVYNDLVRFLENNYDLSIECKDTDSFSEVLKDKNLGKTKKNARIGELFGVTKKSDRQIYSILTLLSGSSVALSDIFDDESLKDAEKKNITFSSGFDDNADLYRSILAERFELIEKLKAVYDWAVLADILNGCKYISQAKVGAYEQHKKDLRELKKYVKQYYPQKYNEIFKESKKSLCNYVAYSGHIKTPSGNGVLQQSCTQENFCAYLGKNLELQDEAYADMFARIGTAAFMPKQVSKDNGVIPMQIHREELTAILNNAKEYLPFLKSEDESGNSVSDKIKAIFDYRIPYYVGPLNTHSKKAWIVRSDEKIYPWNFSDVVDLDKSAEAFIQNLTSKCTYLPDKDVIPKNSILYSEFMVLNEINNLRLDGEKISVELKQSIFEDLFKKYNRVTGKKLRDYLKAKGLQFEIISGIDKDFKSSLKPYNDLADFNISSAEKEEIIHSVTVFGDDKKLLKKRLRKYFSGKLSEEEMQRIFRLRYSDWSSLSKEFLNDVECVYKPTGEVVNIITSLWQTNDNLMQLLYSEDYEPTFLKRIDEMNDFKGDKSMREMVEELYISPKVKRPVYQSLLIAAEIEKAEKCKPKKIFVEVARGEEKKERKASRKDQLTELYKSCRKDSGELYESLQETDEGALRQDKLYLYYTQFGKCMYSGEIIDISLLKEDNTKYDIDHIFPRSKVKDDSLDNRVLVNKTINENKTNDYPLSEDIRSKMTPFWNLLLEKKLISEKKYERLVRSSHLSDDELSEFIARQLVETRQSTKAVAEILGKLYPDTEIVYVKAELASSFRHGFDMLKCREINDFHHAKDAYLNIVAGNVYNVKFTHNKSNFIKGLQQSGSNGFSLNKIYIYDTPGAWVASGDESLKIVKNTMRKNNILYTRYSYKQGGGLFDQNILKKGKGQVPIKGSGKRSDISKYGGYNSAASSYFALIRYIGKKDKTVTAVIPVDTYCEKEYSLNPQKFMEEKGYAGAEIIIPCIKYNACFSFNGFRMNLSSKSGSQLVFKPAVQLVLGYENEKYIRNIAKYLSQFSNRPIDKYDHLSCEKNIGLFDLLVDKTESTIYKVKFGALGKKIKAGREAFAALTNEKQVYVLAEMIKILHCNVVLGDLTPIGAAGHAGVVTMNNNISEIKGVTSVKLINQSVTGLFEQQRELL